MSRPIPDYEKETSENTVAASIAHYLDLRQTDLAQAKQYYFDHLMPAIRPLIENDEAHIQLRAQLRARGFKTLISLMGFSPETTVHAATILRPDKLIIVHSKESRGAAEPAITYLCPDLMSNFDVKYLEIDPYDAGQIYDRISDTATDRCEFVFDITGGTKIMSAAAGALAWERNIDLCYLNGFWDPQSGSAGLRKRSSMKLIHNPSRSRGYAHRREGLNTYARGNFAAAIPAFEASRKLIDVDGFEDFAVALARCYAAMADFDFDRLTRLISRLDEESDKAISRQYRGGHPDLTAHLCAMRAFANQDPIHVAAWMLVIAGVYANGKRFDFASLLCYRSMESIVNLGMKRFDPDFDFRTPDWNGLPITASRLQHRYRSFKGLGSTDLPSRNVGMVAGFAVLCATDQSIACQFVASYKDIELPDVSTRTMRHAVELLVGLSRKRNSSYLAHGLNKLAKEDWRALQKGAESLALAVLGDTYADFMLRHANLQPVDLAKASASVRD